MDKRELRYTVEHRFFPSELFRNPAQMIGALSQKKGEFVWKMYDIIAVSEQTENPFKPENFAVKLYRLDDNWYMIQLVMPKADSQPLCERIYIIFNETFKKVFYYTVERSVAVERGGAETWFLCRWNAEAEHLNYGEVSGEENEEIGRIRELLSSETAE